MRSSVGLPRLVAKPTVVDDGGSKYTLKPGQSVLCNLVSSTKPSSIVTSLALADIYSSSFFSFFFAQVSASMDPRSFPEPEKVKLDRDMSLYAHFGFGPHQCLGMGICKLALTTMLRVVGRLDNLRRAPGSQGQLKKIAGPGGISMYMTADQSSYWPFPSTMKIQWDGDLPSLATN